MCEARSEIRNTAISAISSAVVIRLPKGIFFSISLRFDSESSNLPNHFLYSGVITSAGTIAFTRILYFSNSTAHSLVNAKWAPLEAA